MAKEHFSLLRVYDRWNHSNADDVSTPVDKKEFALSQEYEDGTGANQAQDMYRANGTIAANEEVLLDLAGGLSDVFGDTLTFATIRQITLVNRSTTSGEDLIFGGAVSPSGGNVVNSLFNGSDNAQIRLKPGFFVLAVSIQGYAVTGGSADILSIFNDGTGPIEYDVIIKGTR